ncbi:7471_t:CDS:2, partial [Dentiscutata erythropus]
MFSNFNITNILFVLLIISALPYDNIRQTILNFKIIQNILSEYVNCHYIIFACLFILWRKINSASHAETKKIEAILALNNEIRNNINRIYETSQAESERIERTITDLNSNINRIRETSQAENERTERAITDLNNNINRLRETSQTENERTERNISNLSNNINRMHETSQAENERIERTISNLSNNINRIRDTFQTENERIERTISNLSNNIDSMRETSQAVHERIERVILDLSNEIDEIHEVDISQAGLNPFNTFSTTNRTGTRQYSDYSNRETFWNVFKSLVNQRIARESRSLNSMFNEIASNVNISRSTVYNFYHRRTNPRETTTNEILRWVNGEAGRNNNLNDNYLQNSSWALA